jgi:DNA repair exonuclease SbcCD ATPase subunit
VVADSVPDNWAKDSVLPPERIEPIKSIGKVIKERFKKGDLIDQAGEAAAASLRAFVDEVSRSVEEKEGLIENARKDRDELLRQLSEVSTDCQALLYRKEIAENINLIKEAYRRSQNADYWDSNLPTFATVLRKITSTAKKAHKELVVEDFKARLNDEYLALAEREMSAFGVELKDVGGDGAVTVDHHVAGQKIEAVLSEGEQRIHALALFFAELETCEQQVIVFDDPISSFDYNYIGNYSNRLRDLIQKYPARQVVVLTHNWEFFVQIQTTMNRAGLNGHTAVYVLESCVALDEYSESIDDLKSGIDTILAISGEPMKWTPNFGQVPKL